MGFAHLHVHSAEGSRLDSVVSCSELAKRAAELKHRYLAVTDHGRESAWFDMQNECRKNDVVPIFGVEQYIVPDDELVVFNQQGKRVRCKNNHIVLLAKNNDGLNNLRHLHYISMLMENGHFYYNNHSTFSEVFRYSDGVICGTACMASPFSNALRAGDSEKAENIFKSFLEMFKDNFYVEVQLNEMTKQIDSCKFGQKTINDFMMSLADKYGVPKVITGDVHYLDKEDYRIQDISLAMMEKRTINDIGFSLDSKTLFYHDISDYKDFNERFGYGYSNEQIDEMCSNAEYIASRCKAEIPGRDRMIFPTVTNEDEFEMERLAKEKLAEKFGVDNWKKCPDEYKNRIEEELDVLKRKGFGSYCMVLHDIFRHCEETGLLTGFARGSGGGSLVLYLLGITKIDPIRYDLLFSRFLNDARSVDCVVNYFL